MTHKDAPPETPSQTACREWWTTREPHRVRAWGRDKHGNFLAEESKLLHEAWEAAHLRESEAAKAGVTHEINVAALRAFISTSGEDAVTLEEMDEDEMSAALTGMRAALEAVAPMLANARAPDGLRERIERAWHDHDEDGTVQISMADARLLVEKVLASAPKRGEG